MAASMMRAINTLLSQQFDVSNVHRLGRQLFELSEDEKITLLSDLIEVTMDYDGDNSPGSGGMTPTIPVTPTNDGGLEREFPMGIADKQKKLEYESGES